MERQLWLGRWIAAVLLLVVFAGWTHTAAAAGRVENSQVQVSSPSSLPPLIQGRMQTTVKAIADQLLLGHPVQDVQADRVRYEKIIREVFDKVLVGYSVAGVSIQAAETAWVEVQIVPWADTIRQVKVSLAVEGMPPEVEALVREDLQGVDAVFSQSLEGLPLAAADWSNGVLKHSLNAFMEQHLPEFRADF